MSESEWSNMLQSFEPKIDPELCYIFVTQNRCLKMFHSFKPKLGRNVYIPQILITFGKVLRLKCVCTKIMNVLSLKRWTSNSSRIPG